MFNMANMRFKLQKWWKRNQASSNRLTMRKRKWCKKVKRTTGSRFNHFSRLPDEIVVRIFNKVGDFKSLFLCSLVSKRFSRQVRRVQTISANLQPIVRYQPDLLAFFQKFKEVESVFIEVQFSANSGHDSPLAMWKVKFDTNFPNVEKFVAVSPAASLHELNHLYDSDLSVQFRDCLCAYLGCCNQWMRIASVLIKTHNSLKRVTIADSEKRGKLVIGVEQLGRLKNYVFEPLDQNTLAGAHIGYVEVPVLHLPLSKLVMENVFLLVLTYSTESSANAIPEIASWNFDDEVLGEAVREIHKNHIHTITMLH